MPRSPTGCLVLVVCALAIGQSSNAQRTQDPVQELRDEIFRRGVASDPDVPGQDGHGLGEVLSGQINLNQEGLIPLPTPTIVRGAIDAISGVRETSHDLEVVLHQGLYWVTHTVRLENRGTHASEVVWHMPTVANARALGNADVCILEHEICASGLALHGEPTSAHTQSHYASYVRSFARVFSPDARGPVVPALTANLTDGGDLVVHVAPIGSSPVEFRVRYVADAPMRDSRYVFALAPRLSDPRTVPANLHFRSEEGVELRSGSQNLEQDGVAWSAHLVLEQGVQLSLRAPRTFSRQQTNTRVQGSAARHTWLYGARCGTDCAAPSEVGIAIDVSASMQTQLPFVEQALRQLESTWHAENKRLHVVVYASRVEFFSAMSREAWVLAALRHARTLGRSTNRIELLAALSQHPMIPWLVFTDEITQDTWPRETRFVLSETPEHTSSQLAFLLDSSVDPETWTQRLFAPKLSALPNHEPLYVGTGYVGSYVVGQRLTTLPNVARSVARDSTLGQAIVARHHAARQLTIVPEHLGVGDPCVRGTLTLYSALHSQHTSATALVDRQFSCPAPAERRVSATRSSRATRTLELRATTTTDNSAETGLALDAARTLLRQQTLAAIRGCLRDDRRGRTRFSRAFVLSFVLRRREVENFRIEGNLPEPLRTCLEHSVVEVDVPEFERTLSIRWPLHTEAAAEAAAPEQLENELAAEIRAIGRDYPANSRDN